MARLTATGETTVIQRAFVAYGERDPAEGRAGRHEIGRFTDAVDAIGAARGMGVQGDSGDVSYVETLLHEGGSITVGRTVPVWRRERRASGYYEMGWASTWDQEADAPRVET